MHYFHAALIGSQGCVPCILPVSSPQDLGFSRGYFAWMRMPGVDPLPSDYSLFSGTGHTDCFCMLHLIVKLLCCTIRLVSRAPSDRPCHHSPSSTQHGARRSPKAIPPLLLAHQHWLRMACVQLHYVINPEGNDRFMIRTMHCIIG